MSSFKKQFIFILLAGVILTASGLIIKGATPSGFLKIKPSLTAKVKMVKQENATTTSNNPVGWWKMDEGTGQYAYDVSGNGNTGTLGTSTVAEPADPTWTTGKLGKGLSFDGVNDWVDTTDINAIDGSSFLTVSAWIKPNSLALGGIITKWDHAAQATFAIEETSTGKLSFYITKTLNGIDSRVDTTSVVLVDNSWKYVSFVFDGTKTGDANRAKIYVDGVPVATVLAFGSAVPDTLAVGGTATVKIGKFGGTLTRYFNGSIDDVRIYNRALTAGEVQQQYNSTKDGYLGNIKVSTGLVGYWKLDDNNALTSVIDYSGKGNTGTAYSGTATATSTSVLSTSTAMIGRAMSFDGVDDNVSVALSSSFNFSLTNQMTLEGWIRMTAGTGTYQAPFGYASKHRILLLPTLFYFGYWNTLGAEQTLSEPYTFTLGQWYHIAVVVNNNVITKYVNGVKTAGSPATKTGTMATGNQGLSIGKFCCSTIYPFNGLIDEVKVWNYARTAEQIKQDYERGLKGLP